MDEAQVQALVDAAVAKVSDSFQDKLSAAMANARRDREKLLESLQPVEKESEETPESLSQQAFQTQIDQLQSQIKESENKSLSLRRDNAVLASINALDINNPEIFRTVVMSRYGEKMKEENGSFFVETSEGVSPIGSVFESYLKSDEGALFMPASKMKGTGSKPSDEKPLPGSSSLVSQLENSFK